MDKNNKDALVYFGYFRFASTLCESLTLTKPGRPVLGHENKVQNGFLYVLSSKCTIFTVQLFFAV